MSPPPSTGRAGEGSRSSGPASIQPEPRGLPGRKELSPGAALQADSPRRDRVSWRYSLPKENRAGQKRKLPPEHEGKKGFEFHFTVPWGQTEDFLVAE